MLHLPWNLQQASRRQRLAIPAVLLLIFFLAFSSQVLFCYIPPGPLLLRQAVCFNILIGCLLICYARACSADPGIIFSDPQTDYNTEPGLLVKWCEKCESKKPQRAHHCRVCKICVLKMDHHCPWTANCVGHRNFPHFLRFLAYAVVAMLYLASFLYTRLSNLWQQREMASHYGPSVFQLTHLVFLCLVNFVTLFVLSILLGTSILALGSNVYNIEGMEVERHETLLRRARRNGGYLHGPNGSQIKLIRHEYPYDIGVFNNIVQAMGSSNPLNWLWPFSASPSAPIHPTLGYMQFPTNGFEDPGTDWPPPDPDRMATYKLRAPRSQEPFSQATSQITLTQSEAMSRLNAASGNSKTYENPYDEMEQRIRFHN